MFAASVSEFIVEKVLDLIWNGISKKIDLSTVEFFQKKRIKRQVEDSVEKVLEPLLPFLNNEGINEDKQKRLFLTCVEELIPLLNNPELFFQSSLNGQKIFDSLYTENELPQVIFEDETKDFYLLIFPQIAELLYQLPVVIKEWELLAWEENYKRLDEIAEKLHKILLQIIEIQQTSEKKADEIMRRIRRSLLLRTSFDMDLTGLRGDKPQFGNITDYFIHPILHNIRNIQSNKPNLAINTEDEALEYFCKSNNFIEIIGGAGSGKSTWAKWFQRKVLNLRDDLFVIRIELRSIQNDELKSIFELARNTAGLNYTEELTADIIAYWITNNQVIFLFDGFDEIKESNREKVINWIRGLYLDSQGCSVIITSRPLTTTHLDEIQNTKIIKWTIEPFDKQRIEEYIFRWYSNSPNIENGDRNIDATELANIWQKDPTIEPLTGNPLLLSTLLLVHLLDGALPNGRSQLYKRYIDGMLGIWDDRRKLDTTDVKLTRREKKALLQNFALHIFLQKTDQIDETPTLEWLENYLEENDIKYTSRDVLCVLQERTGLINGPGVYSFSHKSICEYLVAEIIFDANKADNNGNTLDRMYLFEKRNDDHWNSTTFFWAGLSPVRDLISFIKSCLDVFDLPLAYGILLDQHDRITEKKIKRELLLREIPKKEIMKYTESGNLGYLFGVPGLPAEMNFYYKMMMIELRGINSRISIDQLVRIALHEKILSFDDRLTLKTEFLNYFLWFQLPDSLDDVDQIDNYMLPIPSFCDCKDSWFAFFFHRFASMNLFTNDSNEKISLIINRVYFSYPKNAGILLFLVLSNIFVHFSRNRSVDEMKMTKLFYIFQELVNKDINREWLVKTINWQLDSLSDPTDLLNATKYLVNTFLKKNIIDNDQIPNDFINNLDQLIHIRSTILLESDIKYIPNLSTKTIKVIQKISDAIINNKQISITTYWKYKELY